MRKNFVAGLIFFDLKIKKVKTVNKNIERKLWPDGYDEPVCTYELGKYNPKSYLKNINGGPGCIRNTLPKISSR